MCLYFHNNQLTLGHVQVDWLTTSKRWRYEYYFYFYCQKDTVLCSPQPQTTVYRKKKYSFDVMLSELVFSFMLKFEVKKKKRERAGGFFWGGCFPLGQESVSVRGTVAWGLFIVLPWNPVTMLIEPFYCVLQSYVRSIVVKKKPHKTRNYMIVTNYWGSVSSMFQSAKFSVHFLRGIPQVFSWIWRR